MATAYTARDLDRQIVVQRREVVRADTGRETVAWLTRCTVRAAKRDVSGREQAQAGQVVPEAVTRWVVRFREDIEVADRVLYRGRQHDVKHIAELGRREWLQLTTHLVTGP